MTLNQRINWIDWAKVFAIYLVALGHLLSKTGSEGYIFNLGISDKKRPKISCNPFIYYSFEQKTFR